MVSMLRQKHSRRCSPKPAIRFGMASIKGVGEGPVRAIVNARSACGPFPGIEDFCRRVDLRIVNRRALEALIKVGAFEDFGNRAQLLQLIDRMLGMSNSSHRADCAAETTNASQKDMEPAPYTSAEALMMSGVIITVGIAQSTSNSAFALTAENPIFRVRTL